MQWWNYGWSKQWIICFHWIDDLLDVHKDFISLFQVNIIKAETLVKAIEDGQTQFPDNITLWKMRTKYTKI